MFHASRQPTNKPISHTGLLFTRLDRLFIHRRAKAESTETLHRLKQALESG